MKRIEFLAKDSKVNAEPEKEFPSGRIFETHFHGQSILTTNEWIKNRQGNAFVEGIIQMSEKTGLIVGRRGKLKRNGRTQMKMFNSAGESFSVLCEFISSVCDRCSSVTDCLLLEQRIRSLCMPLAKHLAKRQVEHRRPV
jgi:hypothetical protein